MATIFTVAMVIILVSWFVGYVLVHLLPFIFVKESGRMKDTRMVLIFYL